MMNKVFNLTAEQSILANILQNHDLLEKLKLKPKMFQDEMVASVIDYFFKRGQG